MMGFKNSIIKTSLLIGTVIFIIERLFFGNGFSAPINKLATVFIITQFYSFSLTLVNYWYFKLLDNYYSWKKNPKKRLLFGAIGSIILTMLVITILRLLTVIIFENGNFNDFLNTSKSYYIFSLIITANILTITHAIYFFKALTEKKVTKHQVIEKVQSAKFESLKNQLDPHFLFNSLNVLTSLISENPKQAEKFTTKLSKIYRYVLQQKNEDVVLAKNELSFASTYMDLLKMRFEDSIIFEINPDLSNDDFKIIPLSLQLLLENAVKHNSITSQKKLHIKIYEKDFYLIVENTKNFKTSITKSTKVGLQNIKKRYALITNKQVVIEDNPNNFIVKLPLLTKKTNIMQTNYNHTEKYTQAKKKVEKIKEFYSGLFMYCLTIPFLFFIWYYYTPGVIQWFWFPAFGWGIGLFFQGVAAFNRYPFMSKNWEERKIKEIMDQDEVKF